MNSCSIFIAEGEQQLRSSGGFLLWGSKVPDKLSQVHSSIFVLEEWVPNPTERAFICTDFKPVYCVWTGNESEHCVGNNY